LAVAEDVRRREYCAGKSAGSKRATRTGKMAMCRMCSLSQNFYCNLRRRV
jgi:hypothetical protein